MTYEIAQAELENFPVQYGSKVVEHLNRVWSPRSFNNQMICEVGRAVSPDAKHTLHGDTKDGYTWFGRLEYKVDGAKVAVLFPWSQDWNHPETQMDRSINVYSDKELPTEVVENLLEQIAYQTALHVEPQRRN